MVPTGARPRFPGSRSAHASSHHPLNSGWTVEWKRGWTMAGPLRSLRYFLALIVVAAGTAAGAQEPIKKVEPAPETVHKVAIQVNQNDKAVMDLALNNAKNVIDYYKSKGETVA